MVIWHAWKTDKCAFWTLLINAWKTFHPHWNDPHNGKRYVVHFEPTVRASWLVICNGLRHLIYFFSWLFGACISVTTTDRSLYYWRPRSYPVALIDVAAINNDNSKVTDVIWNFQVSHSVWRLSITIRTSTQWLCYY